MGHPLSWHYLVMFLVYNALYYMQYDIVSTTAGKRNGENQATDNFLCVVCAIIINNYTVHRIFLKTE